MDHKCNTLYSFKQQSVDSLSLLAAIMYFGVFMLRAVVCDIISSKVRKFQNIFARGNVGNCGVHVQTAFTSSLAA